MKRFCLLLLRGFILVINAADDVTLKDYRHLTLEDLPKDLRKATPESIKKLHLSQLKTEQNKSNENPVYIYTGGALDVALTNPGYILLRSPGPLVVYPMTRFGAMSVSTQWNAEY